MELLDYKKSDCIYTHAKGSFLKKNINETNIFYKYIFEFIAYNFSEKSTNIKRDEINIMNIIFTNPSARAGYDTRSIFKRSLTGLNSEFSFS